MTGAAVEHIEELRADAPVLLTCEHASDRLPAPWVWPDADRHLLGTHWMVDLGAADLVREMAASLGVGAVLASFTRMLADPNRPEDSPTLFRAVAEGRPVEFNARVTTEDREHRLDGYHRPYHHAVDETVAQSAAPVLFSMHSFTPVYEGTPRSVELGVLFDRDEPLAHRLAGHLAAKGYVVALNEPYSGKEGLMYSVQRHALEHKRLSVELEVRQDLACDPSFRERLISILSDFFR